MFIKFRDSLREDYARYAEIPEEKLKRFVGLISTHDHVSLRFTLQIEENLKPYFTDRGQNIYTLKISNEFFYIDGGYIVLRHEGVYGFFNQNFTEFRVGDHNNFQPIQNISYYYWCYFDYENNIFINLGSLDLHFALTNEIEIREKELIHSTIFDSV